MPRSVANLVENNFVNGLITEATALNFPENACTDTLNCVHLQTGAISRRLGFEFEPDFSLLTNNRSGKAINSFLWEAATGSGDYNFVVVQIGSSLYFYRQSPDTNLSSNLNASTIDLTTFQVSGSPEIKEIECQFSSGKGYLFVVHPYLEPFYVAYDPTLDTFSGTAITIQIRDTVGIDDTTTVDSRLASLTTAHYYNLYNQGWQPATIDGFRVSKGVHPSDADVWWLFKDANDAFRPDIYADGQLRGNTPAPKGYVVLNAFYQDRAAVYPAFVGLPVVTAGYYRPSTTEFFAGRVFYSGVNTQGFSNKIYFSQIIEKDSQFGQCHQVNDMTSEFQFDLLPSDGGYISILDAGTIYKLFAVEGSLIVFANNGVWSISGSSGIGFAANDYTVKKISSTAAISPSSFTSVGGLPCWWNTDGIYVVQVQAATGSISVTSMTEKTIKTFFNDIPAEAKKYAKGCFNPITRVVQWVYRATAPSTVSERYEFNRILNFNSITGAFYPWTLPNDVTINGIVLSQGSGSETATETVVSSALATVTASAGTVTADVVTNTSVSSNVKFLCSYSDAGSYKITFAAERDDSYLDWVTKTTTGVGYSSYFISGYKVHGQAIKKVQANYLTVYLDNEEASTVSVQSLWDYANTGDTGRWSSRQLITTTGVSTDYSKRRLKMRGHGSAFQLKFISSPGEPFTIVGWAIWETGNANI